MKRFLLIAIIIYTIFPYTIYAGNDNFAVGARSAGTANASVTYSDLWSAFHNQAGLGFMKNISVGISDEIKYSIADISVRGFAFALPTKNSGTFALSLSYFGYSAYNEKKAGLAYAKAFGDKVSAGVQLDYLSTHIDEGYGNKSLFTVEAGFLAEVIDNLRIGVHIFNPTRTKLAEYDDERVPTIFKLGLGYTFSQKLIVSLESEKDLDEKNIFKAGIEYKPIKQLYLRTGISTNPTSSAFGIGLELDQFKIDIAAAYHQTLGFSPHLTLSYELK